jgi:hypothetical protein
MIIAKGVVMANTDQEKITLCYDTLVHEAPDFYLLTFDNFDTYIPTSISSIDKANKVIEVPLWFAEREELEMYED